MGFVWIDEFVVVYRYGFMFGRESARKELGGLIEDLRNSNSESVSPTPSHSQK